VFDTSRFRVTLRALSRTAARTLSTTQRTVASTRRRMWSTTKGIRRPKDRAPNQVWDRRSLPNARPAATDRRGAIRYRAGLPVTVHAAGKTFRGRLRDLSETGMLLAKASVPSTAGKVRLDFQVPEGVLPESLDAKYSLTATIVRRRVEDQALGFHFDRPLSDVLRPSVWRRLRIVGSAAIALGLIAIFWLKQESAFLAYFDPHLFAYGTAVILYLLSRLAFASFYRPQERGNSDYAPTVSLIIPCYNEEDSIERTILHALDQRYPEDRYEVIVADDGSTDRSQEVLEILARRFAQLKHVTLTKNVGKRRAMAAAYGLSSGEIVAFCDSDSFLQPDAIEKLVIPFEDAKIGAVCGHCEVHNKWTNIYTKMQSVRYFLAFRIMKAAESVFDSVTCLSGPLAGYRRDEIDPVIDRWINQRFLGVEATFGDDRSLTNFILPTTKIVYQSTAITSTIVPSTFEQLLRQQMRWKRSWIRESVRASRFMWRKQPFMATSFYLGFILPMIAPLVALRALLYIPVRFGGSPDGYFFGILCISGIFSAVYLLDRRSRLWTYGIAFSYFYLFVLLWQLPLATATYWVKGWGTR